MMEWSLQVFMVYVSCLWVTAWSTLLERKLLAGAQHRKGPNKVSWKGVLQPVADALKLFNKEMVIPFKANKIPFILMPILSLVITLAVWHLWPVPWPSNYYDYGVIFFLCLSSCHVYSTVLSGWSANSMYSHLGSMRAIGMLISYEIPLAVILFSVSMKSFCWDFDEMGCRSLGPLIFVDLVAFFPYFICSIAEMHRAPFDLVEAESELVSGYNTDYGAIGFILLFISEYGSIFIGSILMACLWFSPFLNWFLVSSLGLVLGSIILLVRAAYPRVKFEEMMSFCWKGFLPFSLLHLSISFVFIFML